MGSAASDGMAGTGTPMPGPGAMPATLKAGMDGGPATAAVALAVACRLEGVAWRPAVRCKSDAAERFDPAATVFGVGMPADGEDSIEGQESLSENKRDGGTVFSAREKRNTGKRPGGSNSGVGVGVDARVAGIFQISISGCLR